MRSDPFDDAEGDGVERALEEVPVVDDVEGDGVERALEEVPVVDDVDVGDDACDDVERRCSWQAL